MPQPINRWNYTDRGVETTFNDTYRGRQNKKYTASNMKMNQVRIHIIIISDDLHLNHCLCRRPIHRLMVSHSNLYDDVPFIYHP
jgi:hypothetical protein